MVVFTYIGNGLAKEKGVLGKPAFNGAHAAVYNMEQEGLRTLAVHPSLIETLKEGDELTELNSVIGKIYECTLYHLVINFDIMLFDRSAGPGRPIADHWRRKGHKDNFWEIGDVQENGTYLVYCNPRHTYIDQETIIEIEYLTEMILPRIDVRSLPENPVINLAEALGKKGYKAVFGLQSDHYPIIEKWIAQFGGNVFNDYAWREIGREINWDPLTAMCWYIRDIQKKDLAKKNRSDNEHVFGNFAIALFMGYTYDTVDNAVFKASLDLHNYHQDANKLLQVLQKIQESYKCELTLSWGLGVPTNSFSIHGINYQPMFSAANYPLMQTIWTPVQAYCITQLKLKEQSPS